MGWGEMWVNEQDLAGTRMLSVGKAVRVKNMQQLIKVCVWAINFRELICWSGMRESMNELVESVIGQHSTCVGCS